MLRGNMRGLWIHCIYKVLRLEGCDSYSSDAYNTSPLKNVLSRNFPRPSTWLGFAFNQLEKEHQLTHCLYHGCVWCLDCTHQVSNSTQNPLILSPHSINERDLVVICVHDQLCFALFKWTSTCCSDIHRPRHSFSIVEYPFWYFSFFQQ